MEEYNIKNIKEKKENLEVVLLGIKNIINMSYMFCGGKGNYLETGCKSLISLPDISKWNTKNINNMNHIFSGCSSLSSLPDISKWNTNNVINMSDMFNGCSSLSSLPDISKWNINNVTSMRYMFDKCSSDLKIPSKFIK